MVELKKGGSSCCLPFGQLFIAPQSHKDGPKMI